MKIAVLSANLGAYDRHVDWVDQVVTGATVDIHRFTDHNFPGREKAMLSALKCGLPKMFGWQLRPGYDIYIWIDASRGLLRSDTAQWFIDALGQSDLLLFLHPERSTVKAEYAFVKAKLDADSRYLSQRYAGEWIDEQYIAATPPGYVDDRLYASTAFAYRPATNVTRMLSAWWAHKSRYCLHDQFALPHLVREHRIDVVERSESVYAFEHLPITRVKRKRLRRRAA